MSHRRVLVAFLLASLLLAGVVSGFASTQPDGLEYVADSTGFLDTADDSPANAGPLADYGVRGVDDARLSGGLAGVVGAVVTLLVTGALTLVLRRRGKTAEA